jgi:hypothetical protein
MIQRPNIMRQIVDLRNSKRDFSILEQQSNIDAIKKLQKRLTTTNKEKATLEAELQIRWKIKEHKELYKQDL